MVTSARDLDPGTNCLYLLILANIGTARKAFRPLRV